MQQLISGLGAAAAVATPQEDPAAAATLVEALRALCALLKQHEAKLKEPGVEAEVARAKERLEALCGGKEDTPRGRAPPAARLTPLAGAAAAGALDGLADLLGSEHGTAVEAAADALSALAKSSPPRGAAVGRHGRAMAALATALGDARRGVYERLALVMAATAVAEAAYDPRNRLPPEHQRAGGTRVPLTPPPPPPAPALAEEARLVGALCGVIADSIGIESVGPRPVGSVGEDALFPELVVVLAGRLLPKLAACSSVARAAVVQDARLLPGLGAVVARCRTAADADAALLDAGAVQAFEVLRQVARAGAVEPWAARAPTCDVAVAAAPALLTSGGAAVLLRRGLDTVEAAIVTRQAAATEATQHAIHVADALLNLAAGVRLPAAAERAAAAPGLLRQLLRGATIGQAGWLGADAYEQIRPGGVEVDCCPAPALAALARAAPRARAAVARLGGAAATLLQGAASVVQPDVGPAGLGDTTGAEQQRIADEHRQRSVIASLQTLEAVAAAEPAFCDEVAAGLSGGSSGRRLLGEIAAMMCKDAADARQPVYAPYWVAERAAAVGATLAVVAARRGRRGAAFAAGAAKSRALLLGMEGALCYNDAAAASDAGGGGDGSNGWEDRPAPYAGGAVPPRRAVRAKRAEAKAAAKRLLEAICASGADNAALMASTAAGLPRVLAAVEAWREEHQPSAAAAAAAAAAPAGSRRACGACGATSSKLMTCSGCRAAQYCGTDCARRAWPSHKAFCKAEAARLKEAAGAAAGAAAAAAAAQED